MNLTHCLISFALGFAVAALLWLRAFRRMAFLNRFYTQNANRLAEQNQALRVKNEQLDAALLRRDQTLREETGAPSTIQALIFRQILSSPKKGK